MLRTLRALAWVWLPTVLVAVGITYLLPSLGVAANLVHPARTYLVAQAPSLFLFPAFLAIKSFLQAHHETRPALVAAVVANVVNVVVCAVLVLGDAALVRVGLPAMGLRPMGRARRGHRERRGEPRARGGGGPLAAYKRREANVEGAPTLRRIFLARPAHGAPARRRDRGLRRCGCARGPPRRARRVGASDRHRPLELHLHGRTRHLVGHVGAGGVRGGARGGARAARACSASRWVRSTCA
jgi:hypothetical protein